MSRGITEEEVFEAANAILARGERPTIERIRQELGRGSPNTVNRMLDAWWASLATRLVAKEASKLPAPFLQACERLYERSQDEARATLSATTSAAAAENRARIEVLDARERALDGREQGFAASLELLRGDLARAQSKGDELVRANAGLTAQVNELREAKQQIESRHSELAATSKAAAQRADTEIQRVREQWQAQENRWLRQIDAQRDEIKVLKSEKAAAVKEHRQEQAELKRTIDRQQREAAQFRQSLPRIKAAPRARQKVPRRSKAEPATQA